MPDLASKSRSTPLLSRLLIGALAGVAGTAAMTSAMQHAFRLLPAKERYPLPPREISERMAGEPAGNLSADLIMANHFAFGATAGALLIGAKAKSPLAGAVGGVGVWALSHLGWVPALRILTPVTRHPLARNALMIGVHLVWGAATAAAAKDMEDARRSAFAPGAIEDRAEA